MATSTVTEFGMYIDGDWATGAGRTMDVVNPATEEVVHRVPRAGQEDVDRAVQAARRAFDDARWSDLGVGERARYLMRLADILESRTAELGRLETECTGKPIRLSRDGDVPFAIDNLRFFASGSRVLPGQATAEYIPTHTSTIRREPVGVIGQIAPWNYPILMAAWKIGPALAAGNTVVLKPAENTPGTALEMARAAHDAGFPPGVLNVVTGDAEAGAALSSHPEVDMVSLTGDSSTGVKVMQQASQTVKRLHLELGGKAPFVVFADADLDRAARRAARMGTINTGQDCTAATRLYVERPAFDRFVERLRAALAEVRAGDPLDESTTMGPLISRDQLERVQGFVDRAAQQGLQPVVGGGRIDGRVGYFFEPTLFVDVPQGAELVQKEIFGPVLVAIPFDREADALRMANGVEYGLASSVWTRDVRRALIWSKRLNFGTVWINDHTSLLSEMPHGGFKQSGFGKDMSMYALEDYTRIKHVMADLRPDRDDVPVPDRHEGA